MQPWCLHAGMEQGCVDQVGVPKPTGVEAVLERVESEAIELRPTISIDVPERLVNERTGDVTMAAEVPEGGMGSWLRIGKGVLLSQCIVPIGM